MLCGRRPSARIYRLRNPITLGPVMNILTSAFLPGPRRPLGAAGAVRGAGEKSAVSRISRCRRVIARWIARSRERWALREIAEANNIHLLKDIGVSREEAFREAEKPFWRT